MLDFISNFNEDFIVITVLGVPLFGYVAYGSLSSFIYLMRESEEERDNPMTTCHACDHPISKTARLCPNCGENFGNHSWIGESRVASFLMFLLTFSFCIVLICGLLR